MKLLTGDSAHRWLLRLIVTVQVAALCIMSWTFGRALLNPAASAQARSLLIVVFALTLLCAAALSLHILLVHNIRTRVEARQHAEYQAWARRWSEVLVLDGDLPPAPLPDVAIAALVSLGDMLKGEDLAALRRLFVHYRLDAQWLQHLHSASVNSRIEALEALAAMGLPHTLTPILKLVTHPDTITRAAAVRTAARILATVPDDARSEAVEKFVWALLERHLSFGVAQEALILTDDAASAVVGSLLKRDDLPEALLRAAINIVGRMQLVEHTPAVSAQLNHTSAAVRGAALRVLAYQGYVPPDTWAVVVRGAREPLETARLAGVRALALLPQEWAAPLLWEALGDPSWWVRRAAAEALLQHGQTGRDLLQTAAQVHPDSRAVRMAEQSLLDRQVVDDIHAEEWLWAQV